MKNTFLLLALVCMVAVQLSSQQVVFKPAQQITGPFGQATGTKFDMGSSSFNQLPNQMIISHGSSGINSISFVYYQMIGQTVKTGGKQSKTMTETVLGRIVGAQVCTGKRSGATVIIGLKFTYENGITNYFHGNTQSVSNFKCIDATPKTPGYYLEYLSGRYGTYLNQLSLHWVSDFAQEQACISDPKCNQEVNYCSNECCSSKTQNDQGEWETLEYCA